METEEDTFYLDKTLVDGGEHQPTHKNFNPKLTLPTRLTRTNTEQVKQKLRESPTNSRPNPKTQPMEESQTVTLVTVLC